MSSYIVVTPPHPPQARYYAVSRRLLSAREGAPELVGHEVIMKQPYDWASETERKRYGTFGGALIFCMVFLWF